MPRGGIQNRIGGKNRRGRVQLRHPDTGGGTNQERCRPHIQTRTAHRNLIEHNR